MILVFPCYIHHRLSLPQASIFRWSRPDAPPPGAKGRIRAGQGSWTMNPPSLTHVQTHTPYPLHCVTDSLRTSRNLLENSTHASQGFWEMSVLRWRWFARRLLWLAVFSSPFYHHLWLRIYLISGLAIFLSFLGSLALRSISEICFCI